MKRNIIVLILIAVFLAGTLLFRATPALFQDTRCEIALFPMRCLRVTQGPNEMCSHPRQNAMDLAGTDKGRDDVYAPFNGTIQYIDPDYGAVWLESSRPVRYADGTVDHLTVMFLHDSDVSDLRVGQSIRQGEIFYQEGGKGPKGSQQYGNHIHIECMRGRVGKAGWDARGDLYCQDVFFIQSNTEILKDGGYCWRETGMPPRPGAATLKASRPAYAVPDKAVFTWKATPNTTNYEIMIESGGEPVKKTQLSDPRYSVELPPGNYTATIRSVNTHFIEWSTEGNTVPFTVFDVPRVDQILFDRPPPQQQNAEIGITALATGAKYYKWVIYLNGYDKPVVKTLYKPSNQYTWQPEQHGQYIIRVYIQDYKGREVYEDSFPYTIDPAPL